MLKFTVSRDDSIYECFPDIAMAQDGTLVCVYRECMGHAPFPYSTLAIRRSRDGGRTWLPKQVITECVERKERIDEHREWMEPYQVARWEEMYDRATANWPPGGINCPGLVCLADGTLFLIVDFYNYDKQLKMQWTNRIWRSKDSGLTWEGPELAQLPEGLVPTVMQLRNGDVMVGLTAQERIEDSSGVKYVEAQFVCRSSDGGHTWTEPVNIPDPEALIFSEASFVELDDGMLVGILRAAKDWTNGYKVLSDDGGKTWRGPFTTHLYCLSGKPKAGLLKSGEVCITYRHCGPNEYLAMHVVTQGGLRTAGNIEEMGDLIPRQPTPEDDPRKRGQSSWIYTKYYPGRTFYIDIDRSVHRDSGYSGWVQLDSGDIYVVDYINDDAPMAYIRGYLINRSDYILFPDGDLPWLHPSWQPYTKITFGWAERQYMKNRKDKG